MNMQSAKTLIRDTFNYPFDEGRFRIFTVNLLNELDERKSFDYLTGNYIKDSFKTHVAKYRRLGTYTDPDGEKVDVLVVQLRNEWALERSRTMLRNFIADYLKNRDEKDAALVAYYTTNPDDWRFSLVTIDYEIVQSKAGNWKGQEKFSQARRWSFLVGANEKSHTAQTRLVNILANDEQAPTLEEIEKAFDIETVTKEFFLKYRELFLHTKDELDRVIKNDPKIKADFEAKGVDTVNFAKKLLGQIVFLYFLQKKGWFGVGRDDDWGTGSKHFLRELFEKKHSDYNNFYNDILEPLFYEALRIDRSHDDGYYSRFNCKISFLNGGLFDPIGNYDWVHTDIIIPDKLFSNTRKTKEGDTGDGILDIFDRFNFTVKEDEPLEKEVAIDPELLGKAYEKFNAIRPDNYDEFRKALKSGKKGEENKFNKKFGVYYTPREIVHYMCKQSLINYLYTQINKGAISYQKIGDIQTDMLGNKPNIGQLNLTGKHRPNPQISKADIETLIHIGEQVSENEIVALIKEQNIEEGKQKTSGYKLQLSENIRSNAALIDEKLADITVCDPAVGSGAFPVGMMSEIVRARNVLSVFLNDNSRTAYEFKRRCIEYSLYGVDIDSGAVEIAKLRLWLSLIVDEDDINNIKPLPNLDYKIVCGNSLLGVEINLFNHQLFNELEELKPLFFNETNPIKKQEYKKQIDKLISEITSGYAEFDYEVYFSEVFHNKGGFDVVIANPPYVGEKGHEKTFRDIKIGNLAKFRQMRMDLFYFFVHLAINISRQHAIISLITTNYYTTATGAKKLRNDIKNRTNIKNVVNFNELRVFESALGQHNMITILEKGHNEYAIAETCITQNQGIAQPQMLQQILSGNDKGTHYYKVAQNKLYEGNDNYIRLEGTGETGDNSIHSLLNRIKILSTFLGNICNLDSGIQTGVDKVTNNHIKKGLIEPNYINKGVYVLSKDELSSLAITESERRIIKPWYKNSDIKQYYLKKDATRYLIYATRDLDITNYPNIYKHFKVYKKVISNRSPNRGEIQAALKLGKWWVLFVAKRKEIFQSKKIICPQRSDINCFTYHEGEFFSSKDIYYITAKDREIHLKYILSLLNSSLIFHWLYHKGKRKGRYLELYHAPLSEIPIKKIPKAEQKPFIDLVERILAITKDEEYLQNAQKQAKVKTLEREIDQLVYKLYDLTPEEIAIIEGEKK